MFSATSGTPFTVTSNAASVNAPGNTQTADQVMDTVEILGGTGVATATSTPTRSRRSPMCDSAPQAATLRGPGLVNLDASLFRDFRVGGGAIVQFRAEVFNVTNRPAFNNPGANASNPTRAADGTIVNLNGYTEITSAQPTERQARFALRVKF